MLMLSDLQDFLIAIDGPKTTALERAIALLWWVNKEDPTGHFCAAEMCIQVEEMGHPKQNVTRLAKQLKADPRVVKVGKDGWRLHPKARRELDLKYASKSELPQFYRKLAAFFPMTYFFTVGLMSRESWTSE